MGGQRLARAAAFALVAVNGCATTTPATARHASVTPPVEIASSPPDPCGPPPASTRRGGPAHVWLPGDGILRLDATGTTLIPLRTDKPTWLHPGVNGEAWIHDADGLWLVEPTSSTARQVAPAPPRGKWKEKSFFRLAPRSPRDVWAIAMEGEVATRSSTDLVHFDGARWATIDPARFLPPGTAADGQMGFPIELAATARSVWLTASGAVWVFAEGAWKRIEAPPPDAIFAMSSQVVLQGKDGRLDVRDELGVQLPLDDAWKSGRRLVALDPSGAAVFAEDEAVWIGSLDASCKHRIQGLRGRRIRSIDIDDRRRVWLATEHGILVTDHRGDVVADFLPGTLPGFHSRVTGIAVAFDGPEALPAAKVTPRRVDVVGHLRAGSRTPIVGARVEMRVPLELPRSAITDTAGTFRLPGVPEGVFEIDLDAPPTGEACPRAHSMRGYEVWTATTCAGIASGATCDMGELRPCVPIGP